jgi:hypothetical protein
MTDSLHMKKPSFVERGGLTRSMAVPLGCREGHIPFVAEGHHLAREGRLVLGASPTLDVWPGECRKRPGRGKEKML